MRSGRATRTPTARHLSSPGPSGEMIAPQRGSGFGEPIAEGARTGVDHPECFGIGAGRPVGHRRNSEYGGDTVQCGRRGHRRRAALTAGGS